MKSRQRGDREIEEKKEKDDFNRPFKHRIQRKATVY